MWENTFKWFLFYNFEKHLGSSPKAWMIVFKKKYIYFAFGFVLQLVLKTEKHNQKSKVFVKNNF